MGEIYNSLKKDFLEQIAISLGDWGPKLVMAIITLLIGLWIIRVMMKAIGRAMENKHVDATLRPFLITLLTFLLKVLLFLAVAAQIGVKTTSFIAILGAAGLAIGLAMQGALGNFAAGVLLLIFRPYKTGDLIEAQGELGFVKELSVFVTKIETFQNKTVIIPNGPLLAGNIINYSTKGNLRADIPFAIRYGSDMDKAKSLVLDVLKSSPYILKDPAPRVYVTELTNTNIQLKALPFTTVENYWEVFWGLRGEIVNVLSKAGYEAPYEHRVIHMDN